jgi:hypothetical protein
MHARLVLGDLLILWSGVVVVVGIDTDVEKDIRLAGAVGRGGPG